MNKDATTGFQYCVKSYQKAADEVGLRGKINSIDLEIIDMLYEYIKFEHIKRLDFDDRRYFNFRWELIAERLPYSGINGRSASKARFKKLCDVGLIESHPENRKLGQSWYCFGSLFFAFHSQKREKKDIHPSIFPDRYSGNTVRQTEHEETENRTPPVRQTNDEVSGKTDVNSECTSLSILSDYTLGSNAQALPQENSFEVLNPKKQKEISAPPVPAAPPQIWNGVPERIGYPQAQTLRFELEKAGGIENEKFKMLLEWMEYKKQTQTPYRTNAPFVKKIEEFKEHTIEEIRSILDYCTVENNYAGLHWDQLKKRKNNPHDKSKTNNPRKRDAVEAILNRNKLGN